MARLLVIGTGLIGASFALAMRRARCFETIVGFDVDPAALQRAQARGILDEAAAEPCAAAAAADAVIVAVPTATVAAVVAQLVPRLATATVPIFDVCSVKGSIISALRDAGPMPAQYVPCHPMAGSEHSGPDAADAALFRDRHVIITPEPETDPSVVARVRHWWVASGASVTQTSATIHDEMVALTSHLPHLAAFAYMDWVGQPHSHAAADFAGPGVRDFSRIAASDPAMWRQIFAANRTALLHEFDGWIDRLGRAAELLRADRLDELEALLTRARATRVTLLQGGDDE